MNTCLPHSVVAFITYILLLNTEISLTNKLPSHSSTQTDFQAVTVHNMTQMFKPLCATVETGGLWR